MIRFVIVVLAATIGLGAALRSRFGALLFYIWFAIFRPQDWSWVPLTSYRLSLWVGLLLVIPSLVTGVLPYVLHGLTIGALTFLGLGLVAQVNAVNPDVGWVWLDILSKSILVGLFLVRLTNTRERFVTLITVMAGSFAFYSAKAGLASLLSGGSRYLEGVGGGAFADNNGYAVGCATVAPLLIAIAQNSPSKLVRRGALMAVPLTAFTVISTFSRGGFLALLTALAVWVFMQRRHRLLIVPIAAFALIGAVALAPEGYLERLQTVESTVKNTQVSESSFLSRVHVWTVALDVAADYPLGIGVWGFESIYDKYDFSNGAFGRSRAVHNSFLQALTEVGWIGGLIWVLMFVYAFWLIRRIRRRAAAMSDTDGPFCWTMATAIGASLAAFIVGGMTVSMAYNDLIWLLLFAVASLDLISRSLVQVRAEETMPAPTTAPFGVMPALPAGAGVNAFKPAPAMSASARQLR